jgi:polyisoprenoid-binding protein YceI
MSVAENVGAQMLASGSWEVDPAHTAIEFRVRHLMIATVKGRFRDFDGGIVAGKDPSVLGSIRVASLDTLDDIRDEHLRSPDFFDADRYPEIWFRSSNVRVEDDVRFALPGELTLKGITRPLELSGAFSGSGLHPDGGERVAFDLRGELDRTDYGLVWNRALDTGGVLVGNSVELAISVSAVRVA